MMNKEQKKNYISEMTAQFENSKAVMVTHYQGLTMNQLDDLRAKMREHGIKFKSTNNRITKLALEKTRCKDLSNLFSGPTAVALSEDAITSAKILTNFSKDLFFNFLYKLTVKICELMNFKSMSTLLLCIATLISPLLLQSATSSSILFAAKRNSLINRQLSTIFFLI